MKAVAAYLLSIALLAWYLLDAFLLVYFRGKDSAEVRDFLEDV